MVDRPWSIFLYSRELTKALIERVSRIVVGRYDVCSVHSHDHRLAVPRFAPRSCGLARLGLHCKQQRVFPPPKAGWIRVPCPSYRDERARGIRARHRHAAVGPGNLRSQRGRQQIQGDFQRCPFRSDDRSEENGESVSISTICQVLRTDRFRQKCHGSVLGDNAAACAACLSLRAMFRVCQDLLSVFGFGFSFLRDSRIDGVVVVAMYPLLVSCHSDGRARSG